METSPIRQMIQQSLKNDQQIDRAEFQAIKQAIQADGVIESAELAPLLDALTQNQVEQGTVIEVIQFIAQNQSAESKTPVSTATTELPPSPPAKSESNPKQPAATQAAEVSPWKTEYAIQGSFNHTSVSAGWNGQYGSETTATRIEGSFQTDMNYAKDKVAWKNRALVEYGNTFVKGGDQSRSVSRNNLELTSEAAYKVDEKGAFKIEIPYATLYTKGPLTELDGRKFRETSGAKVTFKPDDQTQYSVKVGAGFQQTHDPASRSWQNELGVEMVVEGKQSMGFMKAPVISATGIKEGNVAFLDRLEANVQVNAFNPLQNGMAISNTDIGIRLGARYYLTESKNIWMGVGKQWEYGGKEDSTWENKFTADAGIKF